MINNHQKVQIIVKKRKFIHHVKLIISEELYFYIINMI